MVSKPTRQAATGGVALATVAQAQYRLLRQRPLVDFAVRWAAGTSL